MARPIRRAAAVGWAILFLVIGLGLTVGLGAIAISVGGLAGGGTSASGLVTGVVYGLIGFGFATWLVGFRILKFSWADLRWSPSSTIARGFGVGLLLGAVPAAIAILVAIPTAGAALVSDVTTPGSYLAQVGMTFLILLPAALLEEVMFRGVGQVVLANAFGRYVAIIVLSVLFSLAHIANDHTTALGLVNIGLAGIFLGLVFYIPGGIWAAWGAHFGWNATLAAFDAPVSGLPFPIPAINYLPGQPDWLTGGAFGPEGGALATFVLLGAILMTYRLLNKNKEFV
jgi:membrane protease YdiL (CAAX protease family)